MLSSKGFNWTLHYQQDATFFMPYGWTKMRREPLAPDNINHAENKTRSVVWAVSRCDTAVFIKREHYVAEVSPKFSMFFIINYVGSFLG